MSSCEEQYKVTKSSCEEHNNVTKGFTGDPKHGGIKCGTSHTKNRVKNRARRKSKRRERKLLESVRGERGICQECECGGVEWYSA